MAALAILNPIARKRRKAAAGTKRRRKPMTAKQLKFFGPRKSKAVKGGKRKARKARAKSKVIIVQSNPTKGHSVSKKVRRSRKRKAKVFTHPSGKRRFRKNPRSETAGFLNNTLLPAAIGAGGAIGADILLSYAPIPPQYKAGFTGLALKIGAALLVGAAVGAVSNRAAGEEAAAGGVIVTLYQLSRGIVGQALPGAGMSRYVPMRRYVPMQGWGSAPMNRAGGRPGLGYQNPARIAGPGPGAGPTRSQMRFAATR